MSIDDNEKKYEEYIASLKAHELQDIFGKIDKEKYPEKYKVVVARINEIKGRDSNISNKKELKYSGVIWGFIIVLGLTLIYPIPGWFFIALISEMLKSLGLTFDLVGPPSSVSLGAILTAVLHIVIACFVALISLTYNQRYIATTIFLGCLVTSPIVYKIVKNIMWL